jgi:hypothetical protein
VFEPLKGRSGQLVIAAGLQGGEPAAEAGQGQAVIANGSDGVFSLPEALSLDAGASVEPVDDPSAKEVLDGRGHWNEQRPNTGRSAWLTDDGLSEQEPEAQTGGTKFARGRHREVELERVGKRRTR